jgi:glyoxylase-like metal-dependent hydrolase (beta-lactamase superfamily II)
MTEPREIAPSAQEVVPGLWHWRISNSNIGGHTSSSQALLTREGLVLIDPVRLSEPALGALPRPVATLLTARCHQRAAWRYRRDLGAEVWLPEDATAADEQPDHTYADGDRLPGGLKALRTPGPEWPHYSFVYEGDPGILFCSDLLSADDSGTLHFVDPRFHEEPAATRTSVEKLLDLRFAVLCLDHGAPVVDDPRAAIQELLARSA